MVSRIWGWGTNALDAAKGYTYNLGSQAAGAFYTRVISPTIHLPSTLAGAAQRHILAPAQQKIWYTPSKEFVDARVALNDISNAILHASTIDESQRQLHIQTITTTAEALRKLIIHMKPQHCSIQWTKGEPTKVMELRRHLLNMKKTLENLDFSTPCTIQLSTEALISLNDVQEILNQWGHPYGPSNLTGRVVNLVYRPDSRITAAHTTLQRLQKLDADSPPELRARLIQEAQEAILAVIAWQESAPATEKQPWLTPIVLANLRDLHEHFSTEHPFFVATCNIFAHWNQPGLPGSSVRPSIDSSSMTTLKEAYLQTENMIRAIRTPEGSDLASMSGDLYPALFHLQQEVNLNLVAFPSDPADIFLLIPSMRWDVALNNEIVNDLMFHTQDPSFWLTTCMEHFQIGWEHRQESREHVLWALYRLSTLLAAMINTQTSEATTPPIPVETTGETTVAVWDPKAIPFRMEMETILKQFEALRQLENEHHNRPPANLLIPQIQDAWAHLSAILGSESSPEQIAQTWRIPLQQAQHLQHLRTGFRLALTNPIELDPASDQALLVSRAPTNTDHPSSLSHVMHASHDFLSHWQRSQNSLLSSIGRTAGRTAYQLTFGKPRALPQLNQETKRKILENLNCMKRGGELRDAVVAAKNEITPRMDPTATVLLTPAVRHRLEQILQKFQQFDADNRLEHHAREGLTLLQALKDEERAEAERVVQPEGLAHRVSHFVVDKAAHHLGVDPTGTVVTTVKNGLDYGINFAASKLNPPPSTPPTTTAPPEDPTQNPTPGVVGALLGGAKSVYQLAKGVASSDSLETILQHGHQFFKELKESGIGGLAAASAPMVRAGAAQFKGMLEGKLATLDPVTQADDRKNLQRVLDALEKTMQSGQFDGVLESISSYLEYLGLLPDSTAPDVAKPLFLGNLDQIDDALLLKPTNEPVDPAVRAQNIEEQKKLFVKKTSNFISLKLFLEHFGGCREVESEDYTRILQKVANAGPHYENVLLRKLLLEHLEKQGVSWIKRGLIRIFHPLVSYLIHFCIGSFTNSVFDRSNEFIEQNNASTSSTFANRVVKRFSGYFQILNSALTRIATDKNRVIKGDLQSEIEEELNVPAVNGGMERRELYAAVSDKAIDDFFPKLGWSKGVSQTLLNFQLSSYRVIQVPWHALMCVVAPIGSAIFSIGEWIVTSSTKWVIKRSLRSGQVVDGLIDQSLNALQYNDYVYAINSVLYDKLGEVLLLLQRYYGYDATSNPPNDQGNLENLKEFSRLEKENLRTMIESLLKVVEKGQARSPEELRTLIENPSLGKKALDFINDQFLHEQIVESTMELVGAAFQVVLQKDQLQELVLNFITMANSDEKISIKEAQAKGEALKDRMDNIINLVISKGVEESLDFTKTAETKTANEFNTEIKKIADQVVEESRPKLQMLEKIANDNGGTLPQPKDTTGLDHTTRVLAELLQTQKRHLQSLHALRTKIQACNNLKGSKSMLEKRLEELDAQMNKVIEPLTAIYTPQSRRATAANLHASLNGSVDALKQLGELIRDAGKLNNCPGIIANLSNCLSAIKSHITVRTQSQVLEQKIREIDTSCQNLRKHYAARDALDSTLNLDQPNSSLSLWVKALGTPAERQPSTRGAWQAIEAALAKIPPSEYATTLSNSLRAIQASRSLEEKTAALTAYREAFSVINRTTQIDIVSTISTIEEAKRKAEETLEDCRFAAETTPSERLPEARTAFDHFATTTIPQTLTPIELKPSWIPGQNMIKERASKLVFGIVKKKVDGVLEFIQKPYNWRGLFHRQVCLPFLNKK